MKPSSKKNLADKKIIFNHENTLAVWINCFRIFANRATLNTRLSPLGFEDSNRIDQVVELCHDKLFLPLFLPVKYKVVYNLGKKTNISLHLTTKLLVTAEVNLEPV